jgi:hypothetical protein
MKRHMIGITLLLLGMLFAASCKISVTSALNQQQFQDFIRQRNIQPVAVQDVGGDMTVILYKEVNKMGCYIALARNGIETRQSWDSFLNLRRDAASPVSFTYDTILQYEIICLTINDSDIRQRAHTIKVIFHDQEEITVPVKNNGDMIIYRETENYGSDFMIIIYDSNQQEIIRPPW